ncbi:MAG: hypothetical protein SGI74_00430 [Oligoflexia bacterium]|nr:hypothetical protein [Oligoflexia bacterium]
MYKYCFKKGASIVVFTALIGCAAKSTDVNSSSFALASPSVTSPTSPYTNNSNTVTINGVCVNGYNVVLSGDVTAGEVITPSGALTTTCASSVYQFVVTKAAQGTMNLYLVQVDGLGGTSEAVHFRWIYQ